MPKFLNKRIANLLGITITILIVIFLIGVTTNQYLKKQRQKIEVLESQKSRENISSASKASELVPFSFSQQDLIDTIENLLESDELELKEEGRGDDVSGCSLVGKFIGKIKDGNQYSLGESNYADAMAEGFCKEQSMLGVYSETYWIGNEVFSRQYKDKELEQIFPDSMIAIGFKPREYLQYFFSNPQKFIVISAEGNESIIEVKTSIEEKEVLGEKVSGDFRFIINKTDKKIINFSYSLKDSESNTSNGEATITYSTPQIKLP